MDEIFKNIPVLVSLDIETTGLDAGKDRVVEVALIKIEDGIILQKFSSLINPEIQIPLFGLPVNNIKPDMLQNAPRFKDIAEKLHEFIGGEKLLIQNADFDIPFLKAEFKRCGIRFPETDVYDTLYIAKKLFSFEKNNNPRPHSLLSLAKYYGLEVEGMHRAEKDAMLAYQIFSCFYKEKPLDVYNSKRETADINYVDTPAVLKTIQEAIKHGREICIKYRNRNLEVTTRRIEPLKIFNENGKMYLDAFCSMKNASRKFRLDKILEVIDNI